MKVRNKWNGKVYTVIERKEKTVVLKRGDGSVFEIQAGEFESIYRAYENEID